MARTPLRIEVAAEEPAYSALARLALRHDCQSMGEFLHSLPRDRTRETQRQSSATFVTTVADLCDISEGNLLSSTCITRTDGHRILGNEVVDTVRRSKWSGRICPDCLRRDLLDRPGPIACRPYRRVWWDLPTVAACPSHSVALLTHCPSCQRHLSRRSLSPRYCSCGFDLSTARTRRLPTSEVRPSVYLVERLRGGLSPHNRLLDALPWYAVGVAIDQIGRAIAPRAQYRFLSPPEASRRRAAQGFASALNWPTQFRIDLEECLLGGLRSRKIRRIRTFHVWATANSAVYYPILGELRRLLKRSRSVLRHGVPLGEVANECEVSTHVVEELLATAPTDFDQMFVMAKRIHHSARKDLVARLHDTMTAPAAARLLGIPPVTFARFAKSADICPVLGAEHGTVSARYSRSQIDQILDEMGNGRVIDDDAQPGEAITLERAAKLLSSLSYFDFAREFRTGKLTPIGRLRSRIGLPGVLVKLSEIDPTAGSVEWMSHSQVRARLGLLTTTMSSVVASGLLTSHRRKIWGRRDFFRTADVESFRSKYATAKQILENSTLTTTASGMTKILRRRIQPVLVAKGQYLFDLPLSMAAIKELDSGIFIQKREHDLHNCKPTPGPNVSRSTMDPSLSPATSISGRSYGA
ncbi:MAG: hypothetical protein ACI9LT_000674 [Pseudoalteromonas distincta]|jgi:hypothetical protein